MKSILSRFTRSVAAGAVGVAVLAGTAVMALASDEVPDEPESTDLEVTVEEDAGESVEGDEELEIADTEDSDDSDVDDSDEADEADEAEGDNHGSVVSEAAHDHSFDEACGNHGKYVSAIAKGETPECATEDDEDDTDAAVSDDVEDEDDELEDEDEGEELDVDADVETEGEGGGDADGEDADGSEDSTDAPVVEESDAHPGQGHGRGGRD